MLPLYASFQDYAANAKKKKKKTTKKGAEWGEMLSYPWKCFCFRSIEKAGYKYSEFRCIGLSVSG